jgi:hypothetical protein
MRRKLDWQVSGSRWHSESAGAGYARLRGSLHCMHERNASEWIVALHNPTVELLSDDKFCVESRCYDKTCRSFLIAIPQRIEVGGYEVKDILVLGALAVLFSGIA